MDVTTLPGQTLWDVAVATKGSWGAGIDMARYAGVSMTGPQKAGTVYPVPPKTYDRTMERYALTHRLEPATAGEISTLSIRIFTSVFSAEFS